MTFFSGLIRYALLLAGPGPFRPRTHHVRDNVRCQVFELSMDYHVFILSRVREAFDRGMKTEDAVAHGIKTTAGTVSSAALVMVGVFSIFATLPIIDMKEMGIGLAAAVLIDATIVRAVLLPATMSLLGDRNWYLP